MKKHLITLGVLFLVICFALTLILSPSMEGANRTHAAEDPSIRQGPREPIVFEGEISPQNGSQKIQEGAPPRTQDNSNLVKNGDFEADGQDGWSAYNFGPEFGIDWNAVDQKHGGTRSLKLWATQVTNAANKWEMVGAKQVFPIHPGDVISGGAWLMYENLKNVEVYLECKWLDTNQQELGPGIGTLHRTEGAGKWEYQNLESWNIKERTAPQGAAFVDLRLTLLAAGNADTATGTAWWDDAQFRIQGK